MNPKLKITMKDPDGISESVRDYLTQFVERLKESDHGLSKDEIKAVIEVRREAVECALRKWFEFSEYLHLEVDIENLTIHLW